MKNGLRSKVCTFFQPDQIINDEVGDSGQVKVDQIHNITAMGSAMSFYSLSVAAFGDPVFKRFFCGELPAETIFR
ncbi:MAG: hypothetical protein IPJ75_15720 [Ignavibacteriales bacterium]|nr:hypothetical protein [Ignavibacteriales bacterium]